MQIGKADENNSLDAVGYSLSLFHTTSGHSQGMCFTVVLYKGTVL